MEIVGSFSSRYACLGVLGYRLFGGDTMKMIFTEAEKKFLKSWVLASSIGWPVGIIVAIVLSYAVVNIFYPKETNLIIGLCLGAIVGLSQWLVIKRYFKIGAWWIYSCTIGIGLPYIAVVILNERNGTDFGIFGNEIIDQAILLFIGGIITSLLQINIFKSLSKKSSWWIIISAFAWGIGWFGLIIGGVILGLITGISILRLLEIPVQGVLKKI